MITEDQLEKEKVIKWFEEMDYKYIYGPDIDPNSDSPQRANFGQVVLEEFFKDSLRRLNPDISDKDVEDVFQKVTNHHTANLVQRNREFHKYLTQGVELNISDQEDEKKDHKARIIDLQNSSNNEYLIVNQFTVIDVENRRPDVVVFINGLPISVLELKSPKDENVDIWDAYNQFQTYKQDISDLFIFNEALIISDGYTARVGSLTANEERFYAMAYS